MADWDERNLRSENDDYDDDGPAAGASGGGPSALGAHDLDEPEGPALSAGLDMGERPGAGSGSGSGSGSLAWSIWAAAVLVVVTAGIFIYQRTRSVEPEIPQPAELPLASEEGPAPAADQAAAPPAAPPLPALNESDAFVRGMLQALSAHPALAAFFVDEGLVRRATVIVVNVAEGDDPTRHVRHLLPEEKFIVQRRGARLYIDGDSYRRYDGLAAGFASIDADGTFALYQRLEPLIGEAYRELGYLDDPFEVTLAVSIGKLLAVPVVEDAIAVHPVSVNYQYDDPRLAKLEPAQKLLLRMGPKNVATIQAKLRELAEAFALSL